MIHQHHGRICHLNGCDTDRVDVECPACEQVIGHVPKGGMAQASATWDKRNSHLPNCRGDRNLRGVSMKFEVTTRSARHRHSDVDVVKVDDHLTLKLEGSGHLLAAYAPGAWLSVVRLDEPAALAPGAA